MANYTIIGGDKKEYGPVTPEEMRHWIAEGRLDGHTLARSENDTEWRPLSTFPEFFPSLQPKSSSPPPLNSLRPSPPNASAHEVRAPAICLIVIGALSLLFALWNTVHEIIRPQKLDEIMAAMPQFNDPQFQKTFNDPQVQSLIHLASSTWLRVGSDVFSVAMSVLVLLGGICMLGQRSYEFAVVAAILAMIPCLTPCPCCVFGLPFGIWALIVLRKPGIKDQFN